MLLVHIVQTAEDPHAAMRARLSGQKHVGFAQRKAYTHVHDAVKAPCTWTVNVFFFLLCMLSNACPYRYIIVSATRFAMGYAAVPLGPA